MTKLRQQYGDDVIDTDEAVDELETELCTPLPNGAILRSLTRLMPLESPLTYWAQVDNAARRCRFTVHDTGIRRGCHCLLFTNTRP